jgi:hypothetical protein
MLPAVVPAAPELPAAPVPLAGAAAPWSYPVAPDVPDVPDVPELSGAGFSFSFSIPELVVPAAEPPCVSLLLLVELQADSPNANASKPAKTTLWCFCFMIDSFC